MMNGAKEMPYPAQATPEEIQALLNRGFSQSETAEILGVSKQAISKTVHRHGVPLTPRRQAGQHFPFKVPTEQQTNLYKRLRDHGEYMWTQGEGMSDSKLTELRRFYRRLRENDWVVEFDPNLPPQKGSSHGGWAFRERRPSDGDLIIRVNEHTELTTAGKLLWTFPPRDP